MKKYLVYCERYESNPDVLAWFLQPGHMEVNNHPPHEASWFTIDDFDGVTEDGYLGDFWWSNMKAPNPVAAMALGVRRIWKEIEKFGTTGQHDIQLSQFKHEFKWGKNYSEKQMLEELD